MDKKTQRSILWGLLLVGIVYYIGKRTAAKISIGSAGVRIQKISIGGIQLRIDLPVINESDIPAPVSAFLGQIFYGANPIGLVQLVQPVQVPGFGQVIVPFKADMSLVSLGQQLYDIISKPPVDWSKFSIRGTLKIGPLPIDVNEKLLAA